MTVYVDPLNDWGWVMYGKPTESCHMFTDQVDLTELHEMAVLIGLRRRWFQDKPARPHYDLIPSRRLAALVNGAKPVGFDQALKIFRARDLLANSRQEKI